jgi:hypothetical protein
MTSRVTPLGQLFSLCVWQSLTGQNYRWEQYQKGCRGEGVGLEFPEIGTFQNSFGNPISFSVQIVCDYNGYSAPLVHCSCCHKRISNTPEALKFVQTSFNFVNSVLFYAKRKVERQVEVLIKNLAIFFLFTRIYHIFKIHLL